MNVRSALVALVAGAALATAGSLPAQDLSRLAAAAEKEGALVWYESSPPDQADKVIAAFNKRFPGIKVRYDRIVGGNDLPRRIVQESQAGGPTADVALGGGDHTWQLAARGFTQDVNWDEIGIPKPLQASKFAVISAASIYVLVWNTKKVPDAEVPRTWEALLDPKWKGRLGTWVRAGGFGQLAYVWGADKSKEYLARLIDQKPFLFKSTFPLAQAVAAGEVDMGIGFYHTSQPPIKAGAPIRIAAIDPVPISTIYGFVPKNAKNVNAAKLFLAWLSTPEGARMYEDGTDRGNHLIEGTRARAFVTGKKISEFPPAETERFSAIVRELDQMLERSGTAR
jgi:ABC-type Fe3+ transport system substrate-binding protein